MVPTSPTSSMNEDEVAARILAYMFQATHVRTMELALQCFGCHGHSVVCISQPKCLSIKWILEELRM